ncbi:MAG: PKD domain-containing protein [Actinomycetia bacterium]|nr:PKD domain-containing protein [Actinomycetes bacterium]
MGTRGRWLALAVTTVTLAGGLLNPVGVAGAAPADEQLASTNPQNDTPRVLDGRVQAITRVGDTVLVGGTFTQVQEAAPNSPVLPRSGLFAFDANTGLVSTSFNPQLLSSPGSTPGVDALAVTASGQGVYVGGDFRTINGSGPARLQAIKLDDGAKLTTFANSAFNSRVYDLKLAGDRLYVAGSFTSVGGTTRRGLATLDASSGALTTAVNLPVTGTAAGTGAMAVRKIELTPTGDRLVAIGNFNAVGGTARMQIAMLNTSGPVATLDPWNTSRFGGTQCSGYFDSYMRDVDFAPDGSFFVVVTTGGWGDQLYDPARVTKLCDSASRWETYRAGTQNPTWLEHTGGDTFWSVEVTGPVAYVGGHFRWMNNLLTRDGDSAGAGAVSRDGLAALDTRNGLPFSWNPTRTRGVGVFDFLVTQSGLWAGSDTAVWAGERRDRLAAFPWAGGLALPNDRLGSLPGDVVQLDADSVSGVDVTSRYLTGAMSPATVALGANGVDWSKLRGAFMVNSTLYTGWSDGTFKQQSFDGTTFGPLTAVPLDGNPFGSELSDTSGRITSMFYDRRTGRLYYTRANTTMGNGQSNNDGGLVYRYFTPESGVVGAERFDGLKAASRSAMDAGNVRGTFLVGDVLHFVTSAGVLRSVPFSDTGSFGTSLVVNSQINWAAKGLFLSTQSSIQAPNAAPTAAFTQSCVGLSCSFDGSGSSDGDGTVASYSWSFGDGSSVQAGATPNHVFPAGGSYPVTLTVTDNDGAPDDVTANVIVAPIPSTVAFEAAAKYEGKQFRVHEWQLPGSVEDGDMIVMAVSGHRAADPGAILDADQLPLSGWTEVAQVSDTDNPTVIFTKSATAADAGRTVSVEWRDGGGVPISVRTMVSMGVYSGVSAVAPVQSGTEGSTTNVFAHTSPSVVVPADGDWVVSYWSDLSGSTTSWAPPGGQVERVDGTSFVDPATPTTVRVSGLLTDDGVPTLAGPRPGLTATASGKSTSATMASIVLQSQ